MILSGKYCCPLPRMATKSSSGEFSAWIRPMLMQRMIWAGHHCHGQPNAARKPLYGYCYVQERSMLMRRMLMARHHCHGLLSGIFYEPSEIGRQFYKDRTEVLGVLSVLF